MKKTTVKICKRCERPAPDNESVTKKGERYCSHYCADHIIQNV